MKRLFVPLLCALPLCLAGCARAGEKGVHLSVIYGVAALLSLAILIAYTLIIRKKEGWFYLLFSSVTVVNLGYLLLALSRTLEMALWANRLAYLGSVFLPTAMLLIILNTLDLRYRKWLPALLCGISVGMFAITASPGILPIYYKEVYLVITHGVASLDKVYGPLHSLYLIYLLLYFAAMVGAIIHAAKLKRLTTYAHAVLLAMAVFSNIGVWLMEQLVEIEFEFLSISYIISELFLLGLDLLVQQSTQPVSAPEPSPEDALSAARRQLQDRLIALTPAERNIYNLYLEGLTAKEVMARLFITENTLKYHNKNIYGKLGVSSRKELLQIAKSESK